MEPLRGGESTVGETMVVTRGCPVETATIQSVLATDERPRFAWATPTESVAAVGAIAAITADGPDRFADVRAAASDLFDHCRGPPDSPLMARPRLFGGFAFHHGDHDGDDSPWTSFPGAAFFLPEIQLTVRDGEQWLTAAARGDGAHDRATKRLTEWRERLSGSKPDPSERPGISATEREPSQSAWCKQVRDAVDSITRGELRKVVLAQSLRATLNQSVSVPDALSRLAETYPDCYRFMFSPTGESSFFGATPERLVSLRGRTVRTEALAGSTGRGETPAEDEWLAAELLDSEKDIHEHELVADAISDQLAPFVETIQTGERSIRQLATVQHLSTPITADLDADEHILSLVEALHPTPAVGGLPPDAALRTIRETETFDRGWYAAPVGWIDGDGDGTFAVGIRSAVAQEHTATLFAGAGIVADSDPNREWDEVQLKYRPMLDELER